MQNRSCSAAPWRRIAGNRPAARRRAPVVVPVAVAASAVRLADYAGAQLAGTNDLRCLVQRRGQQRAPAAYGWRCVCRLAPPSLLFMLASGIPARRVRRRSSHTMRSCHFLLKIKILLARVVSTSTGSAWLRKRVGLAVKP